MPSNTCQFCEKGIDGKTRLLHGMPKTGTGILMIVAMGSTDVPCRYQSETMKTNVFLVKRS